MEPNAAAVQYGAVGTPSSGDLLSRNVEIENSDLTSLAAASSAPSGTYESPQIMN